MDIKQQLIKTIEDRESIIAKEYDQSEMNVDQYDRTRYKINNSI